MAHSCCPQSMTPENLAHWIQETNIDTTTHIERIELDEETTRDLEKKSSLASRAIDRLEAVKKEFMDILTNGTHSEPGEMPGDDPEYQPYDVTIPPTKGLKALKANRQFADKQLEEGYKEENTEVFLIPWPEESMVIGVDIEGEEFGEGQYSRSMTSDEENSIKPML